MSKAADLLDAILQALKPSTKTVVVHPDDDETIDRAVAAFREETERWCFRRNLDKKVFELVRNTSPRNDICDESYQQVMSLSRGDCPDRHMAELLLLRYRDRAAMYAALRAL